MTECYFEYSDGKMFNTHTKKFICEMKNCETKTVISSAIFNFQAKNMSKKLQLGF